MNDVEKDIYNLQRFVKAQEGIYEVVLGEILDGQSKVPGIHFLFPKIKTVGLSPEAAFYAISNYEEAEKYINHPLLGKRLVELSEALLSLESNNPDVVMGSHVNALHLKSSMTLFEAAAPHPEIFGKVLTKYFGGQKDYRTIDIIFPHCD
jgi:uncharacterized protein (DUF1810 family)